MCQRAAILLHRCLSRFHSLALSLPLYLSVSGCRYWATSTSIYIVRQDTSFNANDSEEAAELKSVGPNPRAQVSPGQVCLASSELAPAFAGATGALVSGKSRAPFDWLVGWFKLGWEFESHRIAPVARKGAAAGKSKQSDERSNLNEAHCGSGGLKRIERKALISCS